MVPAGREHTRETQLSHSSIFIIYIKNSDSKEQTNMTEKVHGSVLVLGGGIAGMQASLDLANSGYLVHLVESHLPLAG